MPPRLARLLAVVAAVALVAGAFAVRGALAGDDEDGGGPGPASGGRDDGGDGGDGDDGDGRYAVVCDEDLGEDVCTALAEATGAEVDVRPAGDLLADATAEPPYDAWLTLDPVPAVLDVARQEAELPPLTDGDPVAVASSRLALLALPETPGACADEIAVGLACVIEAETTPPVAVPRADTALGVLAIAAGATAVHGDADFGIDAFRGTPEADRLGGFLDDSPTQAGSSTADQTAAMAVRPGAASAAVTVDAIATRQAGTVQGQGRELRSVPLDPEVVVSVTLVGLGPQGRDAVDALTGAATGQTVADALTDAGWDGEAARSDGLPEADVIYALREELG